MASRINRHHIYYGPDWIVEVNWLQHKALTNLQQMGGTEENYAKAVNFQTAVNHEVNRIRAELDTGRDMKVIFRGKEMFKPKQKPLKIKRRRLKLITTQKD